MPTIRRQAFKQFADRTTLHGLRYMFIGKQFSVRRLIWAFLLLAAVAMFGLQVTYTLMDYLKYKTTVTTRRVSAQELPFPAVTVCNQNQFRATASVEYGLFDMIEKVLQGRNVSGDSRFERTHVNVTNFFLRAAHQKKDLVRSCKWRGRPCNIEKDFSTSLTEHGVCYTFTGPNKRQPLTVTDFGVGSGLQLLLNIEQYDYIPGPYNDAGVKVLLHERESPAAVSSTQFLVGPGSHAMAAVTLKQVNELARPYGSCESGSSGSHAQCLATCWAKRLMNLCGCQDPFISSIVTDSTPRCSVTTALGCVQPHMGYARRKPKCNCPKPCSTIEYEPSLSYSQLLKLNAEKMAIENDSKMGHLRQSFVNARAVSEKHIPGIAKRDRKFVSRVVEMLAKYYDHLAEISRDIQNEADLWQQKQVIHVFDRLTSAINSDLKMIKSEYDKQKEKADSVVLSYATALGVHLHHMKQFFGKSMSQSDLLAKVKMCNNTNNAKVLPNYAKDCQLSNSYWQGKVQQAKVMSMSDYLHNVFIDDTHKKYLKVVNDLFRNMSRSVSDISDHRVCLASISQLNQSFWESVNLCKDYLQASTFLEKAEAIYRAFNNTNIVTTFNSSLKSVQNSCHWYSLGWDTFSSLLSTKINTLNQDQVAMRQSYGQITTKLQSMKTDYLKDMIPIQKSLEHFLQLNGSKMHLADKFVDLDTKRALSEFQQSAFTILSLMRQFDDKTLDFQRHTQQTLLHVFNFTIPIVPPGILRTSEINKIGDALRSKYIIDYQYKDDNPSSLSSIIVTALDRFRTYLGDSLRQQFNLSNLCLRTVAELEAVLKEYVQENTMNERFYRDNFLQLDIFFNTLNYEIKNQEIATALASVLAAIGSYSVIWLGASVLTFFEFLDFLIRKTLGFCMRVEDESPDVSEHIVPSPPPPPGPKGKVHIYHVPDSPEDIYSVVPDGPPYNSNYRGTPHKSPLHQASPQQQQQHHQLRQQQNLSFASPKSGGRRGLGNEQVRHQVVRAPQPHIPQFFDRELQPHHQQHQQQNPREFTSPPETFKPQSLHHPQFQHQQQISQPVRI